MKYTKGLTVNVGIDEGGKIHIKIDKHQKLAVLDSPQYVALEPGEQFTENLISEIESAIQERVEELL